MYERYGKMESLAAINAKAEELFNAGDVDGLRTLAAENSIPEDYADLYLEGETPEFVDIQMFAEGRIRTEAEDLGVEELLEDWAEYVIVLIEDSPEFAEKVIKNGRTLIGCIGELCAYGIMHAEQAPAEVCQAINRTVTEEQLKKLHMERRHIQYTKIGMPGMGTAKRIIRQYFGG